MTCLITDELSGGKSAPALRKKKMRHASDLSNWKKQKRVCSSLDARLKAPAEAQRRTEGDSPDFTATARFPLGGCMLNNKVPRTTTKLNYEGYLCQ